MRTVISEYFSCEIIGEMVFKAHTHFEKHLKRNSIFELEIRNFMINLSATIFGETKIFGLYSITVLRQQSVAPIKENLLKCKIYFGILFYFNQIQSGVHHYHIAMFF